MWKQVVRLTAIAGLSLLSACASIVSGTDSATYIETKPVDARCRLHGQDFTREINTPTSVPLPSRASPITVECNAEGYQRTTQQLEASMDGWIFGNLIFGGIVGGVVDIARGAGKKYPPQFQIVMDPAAFQTAAERDRHYDDRVRLENERWDRVVATIRSQCDQNNPAICSQQIQDAEARRKLEIDRLEANRRSSRVLS